MSADHPFDGREMLARLKALPPERRREALDGEAAALVRRFDEDWPTWAHGGQLPPHDDWTIWVQLCGRGFGKTRAGAEWVAAKAREHPGARIALVGTHPKEVRRAMVEGRSGVLRAARSGGERQNILWEPGLGRVSFASGAEAFVYSGADGDSLRSGEHDFAWCDELAKWRDAQSAWNNLLLTLRTGGRPQIVVTTTPRAVAALRMVLAMPDLVLTGGASLDNPHLTQSVIDLVRRVHRGTRWARQELEGELIEDFEGALWTRELIEACRAGPPPREALRRVLIGVDPPASAEGTCGIVVCGVDGLDGDRCGYVLADLSASGLSPGQWARRVVCAAETWGAERVVVETNQGGNMVTSILKAADGTLPVGPVRAKYGKSDRAEPVAMLFESGNAKFAGTFPALEDQLCGLIAGGGYEGPGKSPDRADAMVWALAELMLGPQREPRIRVL